MCVLGHRSKLIVLAGLLTVVAVMDLAAPAHQPLSTYLHSKGVEAIALVLFAAIVLVAKRRK